MSRAIRLGALGALCAALLAGCEEPNKVQAGRPEIIPAPPGTISVYKLAGRLGMSVAESTRYTATLRNPANTVMVYGDPGGAVFVNGKQVGPAGGLPFVSGILFVPLGLAEPIRSALRPVPVQVAGRNGNNGLPAGEEEKPPVKGKVKGSVVIDAGHGGKDPGTPVAARGGRNDRMESHVNLALALAAADKLKKRGAEVTLTRRDDTFLELEDRSAVANRARADLFVSIHCDSPKDSSVHGFAVYTSRSASGGSVAAAKALERHMGASGAASRGLREANYRVLVLTVCPSVLIETGCLSNAAEAARLADSAYQDRLAEAIADGVAEYLQKK